MTPQMVFGGFLTEYCRSWVPRTRRQLATRLYAVSGLSVPEHHIREWQKGQAPGTGREMLALLEVLRRDGLSKAELHEVMEAAKTAKLAAAGWGDLAPAENISMSPAVADFAEAAYKRTEEMLVPANAALLYWLDQADAGALGAVSRRLRRSQMRARAFLRCRLGQQFEWTGRFGRLTHFASENAHLCAEVLGNAGHSASALFQRAVSAYAAIRAGDRSSGGKLWEAHEALWALGPSLEAVGTYLWMLDLWEALPPSAVAAACGRSRVALEWAQRLDPHGHRVQPLLHLIDLARRRGRWDEVADHLQAMRERPLRSGLEFTLWHLAAGDLHAHTGQHRDAEICYREALWQSREAGLRPQEDRAVAGLRAIGCKDVVYTGLAPLPTIRWD